MRKTNDPRPFPLTQRGDSGNVKSVSDIDAEIKRNLERTVDFRHRLHRIPELMYQEHLTAQAIRAELDRLSVSHVDGIPTAPTATIATIGSEKKPCIALRADIDALPIEE